MPDIDWMDVSLVYLAHAESNNDLNGVMSHGCRSEEILNAIAGCVIALMPPLRASDIQESLVWGGSFKGESHCKTDNLQNTFQHKPQKFRSMRGI